MDKSIFLAELVGTCLMIILGSGVVANVNLNKSGMKGGGSVQITIAWGLAVLLPCFIFSATSGANFNPALTIALVADGTIDKILFPSYILGQFLGAFLGAIIVYILFKDHIDRQDNMESIRGIFCTSPSIRNYGRNLLSEIIGTFILVFTIKGISQVPMAIESGVDKILVFSIIVSIGMSLGGLTGYAINPARDLGPRLAYAILPIKGNKDPDFAYSWIPIVGPIIGALLAVYLYAFMF